ncbi:hypothetical protein JKF63_02964 [Porcisia hertigi]|uniref:Protein kinase domain-containing protein n=1 Tax=Porcisia hertigi TaxID=2761500 RepID=A0A836I5G3_9TRYP|nr:hypothetical protein JKF63_02964 [Porcisia hertigi]
MAHFLFAAGGVAAATLPMAADRDTVSPAWSIYDDCLFGASQGDEVGGLAVEEEGMGNREGTGAHRLPYISDPVLSMTLKGSQLKKEAPIRRGAQGAVYSALDPAVSTIAQDEQAEELASQEISREHGGNEHVAGGELTLARCGRHVAVKRIFIQTNDFSARDISATVLREVTLHRFVSDKQAACLAARSTSDSTAMAPGATAPVEVDRRRARGDLLDDSARVIHLYRVVEAPHKGMCLVMELAATNLEQIIFAHGAGGASKSVGAGGHRRKPGIVSLFASSASTDVGSGLNLPFASSPTCTNEAMASEKPLTYPPPSPLSRIPLVRYVMRRLLRLVCFLHETCGVVHRDLKLTNVLVTKDAGLRLGDFGSARFFPPLRRATTTATGNSLPLAERHGPVADQPDQLPCTPLSIRTTLHYRSPEALLGAQACRTAADIWALGVIFAQLLLEKRLFNSMSELDLLGAIQKLLGVPTYKAPASQDAASSVPGQAVDVASVAPISVPPPSLPYKFHAGVVSADGLDLLSRMLHQQPECRITARGALQHPFLNLEGISTRAAHDDDERGRALWEERVEAVLREQAAGSTHGMAGGGRPVFMRLAEDEDEEDEEYGVAPFRVNLGGYTSS